MVDGFGWTGLGGRGGEGSDEDGGECDGRGNASYAAAAVAARMERTVTIENCILI